MNEILQNLGSRLVFFDGAMGTQLQAKGLPPGYAPELWNLERPETIRAVHAAYLEAGAQVLKSNTFGANPIKCRELGVSAAQLVAAGVTLAGRLRRSRENRLRWRWTWALQGSCWPHGGPAL